MGPKKKDKSGDSGDTLTRIAIVGAEKCVVISYDWYLYPEWSLKWTDGSVGRSMQASF